MTDRPHTRWLVAVFVIAAVLFLAPSAMAANAAVLTLSASPAVLTSGQELTLAGNLSDASTGSLIPMQKITVQSSPDGESWTGILSTISRTGQFQVKRVMKDPGISYFRVQFSGNRQYTAAASPPVIVTVKPSTAGLLNSTLSIAAAPRVLEQGGEVTLSGALVAVQGGKAIPGQTVILSSSPDGVNFSPIGLVSTAMNGRYSATIRMNTPGRSYFRAAYNGDSTYSGSVSAMVAVDVNAPQQKTTTLSIAVSNTSIPLGRTLDISGVLKESYGGKRIPGATVTVQFSPDGVSWSVLGQRTTDANGQYLAGHTPSKAGTYQYRASYAGNTAYDPSTSPTVSVNVTSAAGPGGSALSIRASPATVAQGGTVTVSGALTALKDGKGIPGRSVIVYSSPDGVNFSALDVVRTGINGTYSGSTTLNSPGRVYFRSAFNGDQAYTGSGSTIVAVDVTAQQQKPTALSIRSSAPTLVLGQSLDLTGVLAEAGTGRRLSSAVVAVQFSLDGSAWSLLGQKATDAKGEYLVTHTPPKAGTYQYRATYAGNATYAPSGSLYVTVTVRSPAGLQDSVLSVNATPGNLSPGGTVTIQGNLSAATTKKGIPGRSVIVYSSSDGTNFSPLGVVTTAPNGKYSTTTQLNSPGRYLFKAVFSGDSTFSGSESAVVGVNVSTQQQKATTLSIGAAPASLVLGQAVNVTGVLKETQGGGRIPGAVIAVQFSLDGATWSALGQKVTDANGEYLVTHTPPKAGNYQYRAAYAGDTAYLPSGSPTVGVKVSATPPVRGTALSIQSTPASPGRGETYTIGGLLRDTSTGKGIQGKVVRVEQSADGTTWSLAGMTATRSDGNYAITQVQQYGGRLYYRAKFSGDRSYQGSTSPLVQVIVRRASEVSLSASPVVIRTGDRVNCTGALVDAKSGGGLAGETVKVMISQDDTAWTVFGSAVTGSGGSWNLSAKVPNAGTYHLAARFEGSAFYDEDWSNSIGITVG